MPLIGSRFIPTCRAFLPPNELSAPVPSDESIARSKTNSFAALRRFREGISAPDSAAKATVAVEQCELCGLQLGASHRHLLETATRRIVCACDGCAMTFVPVVGGRFQAIPRDARALPHFQISDSAWESLALPINLAFFFHHSPNDKIVALYPGPAGATESLLPLTAWEMIVEENPILRELQPDVEALLVRRTGEWRSYFIAPIDKCFELVGLIRMHWRGFTGGEEAWLAIDHFFTKLKETAR
jgi:hypothetical protein